MFFVMTHILTMYRILSMTALRTLGEIRGINFLFDMFNFYLPLGSLNTKSTMLYKKCKC